MKRWQKISLFQRLYFLVICVVEAIRGQMQRELMGAKGFVAGLVKTDRSSTFYTKDKDGVVTEQFILSASGSSLANAVVAKVMGRDLFAAHEEQLTEGTNFFDFLPPWARIWLDDEDDSLDDFLGIGVKWQGHKNLQHYNSLVTLDEVVDSEGNPIWMRKGIEFGL